jgi:fluoroquinolone transport system permease protein
MNSLTRLYTLTLYNIKLQFRQGFYFAWIFMTLFYILILYFLPRNIKDLILPLIMLSEPSTFAMIFTGAIVLLERDEKMFENLFITPLPIRGYIYSKMISIAIPATICTFIISSFSGNFSIKLFLLVPGVILTTFFFVVFSLILSVSAKNILSLVGKIGLYGSIFGLSILDYFGIFTGYFQYILPTKGSLVLISTAVGYKIYSFFELFLAITTMTIAVILILVPAEKSFQRQIINQGGD